MVTKGLESLSHTPLPPRDRRFTFYIFLGVGSRCDSALLCLLDPFLHCQWGFSSPDFPVS